MIAAKSGAVQVNAFEPMPEIADIMADNLQHNYAEIACPISLHRFALAEKNGSAELFVPDQRHGLVETSCSLNPGFRVYQSGSIEVPVYMLDDFLMHTPVLNDISLILKLDVESCEPQVLKGADTAVRTKRPIIFLEIFPEEDLSFYYQWMDEHLYNHFNLSAPNGIVPSAEICHSPKQRDHLFAPKELDVRSLFYA